jgi:myosin heavy subunit
MNRNGVMEEIRSLLSEGRSSTETIALGYKPSTVYKAQRQLGKSASVSGPPVTTQVLVTNMASEDSTRLREENQALQEQVSSLAEVTAEKDSFREELDLALTQIEELAIEAGHAQMWQERLAQVEPAAAEAAELRREVRDLNRNLNYSREVMDQQNQQWQADLQQEQEARKEADNLVAHRSSEIVQLKAEKQNLARQLEILPDQNLLKVSELVQPLKHELAALRKLKVWADHPCSRCGKPVQGVPSREVAAKILRQGRLVHGVCVNE